ncbi:MAG: hypothetical protein IJC18_01155, partial [Clostridia bacterium]|nr:hypothetical protein [Clostridia bacterium]
MTNSKKRIITMAAAVLATLAALLLLVIDWSACSREEDFSHADHVHTDTEHELLIDRQSDELESMTLTNAEGTFTLRRDEQSGLIEIAELEGIPQNSEFIEMVWYYALTIGYGSKLEITEEVNLADFGLDSPAVTVKNTYHDGTTTGFKVGSLVA